MNTEEKKAIIKEFLDDRPEIKIKPLVTAMQKGGLNLSFGALKNWMDGKVTNGYPANFPPKGALNPDKQVNEVYDFFLKRYDFNNFKPIV